MMFAKGNIVDEPEVHFGKLTCMWENGNYLGVKATTGDIIVGNRRSVAHEDGQKEARERTIGTKQSG